MHLPIHHRRHTLLRLQIPELHNPMPSRANCPLPACNRPNRLKAPRPRPRNLKLPLFHQNLPLRYLRESTDPSAGHALLTNDQS